MSTKTINYGSQRIEAAAERLSLCKPATHPIGTVVNLALLHLDTAMGNSRGEAISGKMEKTGQDWETDGEQRIRLVAV